MIISLSMAIQSMFRTSAVPISARVCAPTSSLSKSIIGRLRQNATRIPGRQLVTEAGPRSSNLTISLRRGFLYASSVSAFTFATSQSSKVLCDASGIRNHYSDAGPTVQRGASRERSDQERILNYRELAMGSFAGLFVGLLIGKISRLLVFLAGSTFLLLQFLASRRVITLPYNRFYRWAKERYGNKELILENMSFKVAFGAALIVAAANA
ncbi:hypothetical protein V1525DRAFT_397356 [Lipomyces kononenkoae]|uniref:Uncharacterized protein n=1 Tax=Lipomyces kononenkoae TaxID=34357 RepID=A0ACC3T7S0_LIPKO